MFLYLSSLLVLSAGGVVHTADYAPHWEQIPAPSQPLSVVYRQNGFANGLRPAGSYEIAYSLVDEQGRVTAPSPTVRLAAYVRDWQCAVDTPGLDPQTRAFATCWWFRVTGTTAWQPLGAQMNAQLPWQVLRPFVPLAGWAKHSMQSHELFQAAGFPGYDAADFWGRSPLLPPTQPPSARLLQVDNVAYEACYSWRCNDGETDTSPAMTIPAFTHPFDVTYSGPGFHCPFTLGRNVSPPQGALGFYLYLRPSGTKVWHRQPCPSGRGDLWPLDHNHIEVRTFVRSGITPGPVAGRSWLSGLHLALRDGNGADVIVDDDVTVCCPVISAYGPEGRTISKVNGGRWVLRDTGTVPDTQAFTGYPRGWPLWLENAYNTRLVGCRMELADSDCGVAFLDHLGKNAAGDFRGTGLSIQLAAGNTQRNTYGVRCLWQSRGALGNDHSASEPIFRDFHAAVKFPVVVEGNQSANWLFDVASLASNGDYDSAIITQSNSGTLTFLSQVRADNARCLLAATTPARCTLQGLWIDQGMPAWVTTGSAAGARLRISGSKVNQWSGWLHVCESPCAGPSYAPAEVRLDNLDSQGPPTQALCCQAAGGTMPVLIQVDPVALLKVISPSP